MHKKFHSSPDHAKTKGILFGLLLVVAGLLFLSFNFGWIDPALKRVILSWPMIFILFGIFGFSKNNYILSLFWFILGLFFLIPRIAEAYPGRIQGVDSDFALTFWPLLLILFGVGFILKVLLAKRRRRGREAFYTNGRVEEVNGRIEKRVFFSGSENIFLDSVFQGGEITALFGGVVLDLRKTQLPEGVTYLNVDATFGGVDLLIPGDWFVETKFQIVMGGFEDKRSISVPDKSRRLIIQGDLIFGGCDVR